MASREGTGMRTEITLTHRFLFWSWNRTYVGSVTVWHRKDDGSRAPSHVEERLAGLYAIGRPRHAGEIEIAVRTGIGPWTRERRFLGTCSVWHDAETGERPGVGLELRLARRRAGRRAALAA
jgi:hypothetical protein